MGVRRAVRTGEVVMRLVCALVAVAAALQAKLASADAVAANTGGVFRSTLSSSTETLLIGGAFRLAGDTVVNGIAAWNGAQFAPMGTGVNGTVQAVASWDGKVVVGGLITSAGGVPVTNVAQWDGTAWTSLGAGLSGGAVRTFCIVGDVLYAGGDFTMSGYAYVYSVAAWNRGAGGTGSSGTWYSVNPSGTFYNVAALIPFMGNIAAASPAGYYGPYAWNGYSWSQLGYYYEYSTISYVSTLATLDPYLYAATTSGVVYTLPLVSPSGSVWSSIFALNGAVSVMTAWGRDLYLGGSFTSVTTLPAGQPALGLVRYFVRWDGTSLSPLGFGLNGDVRAATPFGSVLVVGGDFTTAGGKNAPGLAVWNGQSWHPISSTDAVDYIVYALAPLSAATMPTPAPSGGAIALPYPIASAPGLSAGAGVAVAVAVVFAISTVALAVALYRHRRRPGHPGLRSGDHMALVMTDAVDLQSGESRQDEIDVSNGAPGMVTVPLTSEPTPPAYDVPSAK